MRYFLSCLLILISIQAHAFSAAIQAVLGATTAPSAYFFQENFEAPGYENSWTEDGGAVINDQYGTALVGSYSLLINPSDDYPDTYSDVSAQSHAYGYFRFKTTFASAPNSYPVVLKTSGGAADIGWISFDGAHIRCNFNGGTPMTATHTVVTDTEYHLWWEFQASTGSDGMFKAWISSTGTIPESADCSAEGGTQTGNMVRYTVSGGAAAAGNTTVVDKIRMSTSIIGSNPD